MVQEVNLVFVGDWFVVLINCKQFK